VQESASVLTELGAEVVLKRYPGIPHTIIEEEIEEARKLIDQSFGPASGTS